MTAPSFQHPPTPPAIPGDFVPSGPIKPRTERTATEIALDVVSNVLDTLFTVEILEDIL